MPHALIITNEDSTRITLAALVKKLGFSLEVMSSLKDTGTGNERNQADVVLIDVQEGSLVELPTHIRTDPPPLIVILSDDPQWLLANCELGSSLMIGFIKPFNPRYLRPILVRVARRAG